MASIEEELDTVILSLKATRQTESALVGEAVRSLTRWLRTKDPRELDGALTSLRALQRQQDDGRAA